jgi:hypothetical protein
VGRSSHMLFEAYMLELVLWDWGIHENSVRWLVLQVGTSHLQDSERLGVTVGNPQPGTSQMHLHETEVMYSVLYLSNFQMELDVKFWSCSLFRNKVFLKCCFLRIVVYWMMQMRRLRLALSNLPHLSGNFCISYDEIRYSFQNVVLEETENNWQWQKQ